MEKVKKFGVLGGFEFLRSAFPVDLSFFHEDDAVGDTWNAAHFMSNDNVGDAVIFLKGFDEVVDGVCSDGV